VPRFTAGTADATFTKINLPSNFISMVQKCPLSSLTARRYSPPLDLRYLLFAKVAAPVPEQSASDVRFDFFDP